MRLKLIRLRTFLACRIVGHRWRRFNHRAEDSAARQCSRCGRFEVADTGHERWYQIKWPMLQVGRHLTLTCP